MALVNESDNAFAILLQNFSTLAPTFAALALTALVIFVSSSFTGTRKVVFLVSLFLSGLTVAAIFLYSRKGDTYDLINSFTALSADLQFALSLLVITVTYFGGAVYIGPPYKVSGQDEFALRTPASCDRTVDFEVPPYLPVNDTDFFDLMFKRITDEIIADLPTIYEMPPEAVQWIERMIKYTVEGGKMNRGLTVVAVQSTFAKSKARPLTDRDRCQSAALGWCVEFLQAFFLVADDAMDDSVTRRGQSCWFRLPEVKLISINDSFILESCVYKILKRYLGREKYYSQVVDLFIETTRQTEFGQLLDLTSQPLVGGIDLSRFTLDRYSSIVKYKTAFYSFYLPVALGMIVSGIDDSHLFDKAREILLIMGEYFQIQDDYLDCFGSPDVIGKIGTDIEDNKCSWLVVQALSFADAKQRQILEDNYGQHSPKNVSIVKKLYADMELEKAFHAYEEASYAAIQTLLAEVHSMPTAVFEFLLSRIYKRSK